MILKLLLNAQMNWMVFLYNPNKKREILIVFDDMIADILSNKKLYPIVTELFIRGRNIKISFVFTTQFYFAVSKLLGQILRTALLWTFQTKKNFNKLHVILHQISN